VETAFVQQIGHQRANRGVASHIPEDPDLSSSCNRRINDHLPVMWRWQSPSMWKPAGQNTTSTRNLFQTVFIRFCMFSNKNLADSETPVV
jgi:hypothetical protein